jgi:hypothetical protein
MLEIIEKSLTIMKSIEGSALTIAIVLEMLFRFIPSEKPLSVIRLVASAMKGVGTLLVKLAEFSDKVLPQKLK